MRADAAPVSASAISTATKVTGTRQFSEIAGWPASGRMPAIVKAAADLAAARPRDDVVDLEWIIRQSEHSAD
jgi:hypothetical protein